MKQELSKTSELLSALRALGGTAHTQALLDAGVHPRELYAAVEAGALIELSRGVYRLAALPVTEPDLLPVLTRMPRALLCLTTALHLHGLTQEIPKAVHVALPRGVHPARLHYPPLEVYHFSPESYAIGVEAREIDSVPARLTSPAKSVVDAFKFRGRLGLETALDALRQALGRQATTPAELDRVARACRMQRVMRPYLEALT